MATHGPAGPLAGLLGVVVHEASGAEVRAVLGGGAWCRA